MVESLILIFAGSALLATLALYMRQPLLVAYIAIGIIVGPHALSWVADAELLRELAEIGIIFLLFLVGLDHEPGKLLRLFRKGLITACVSSVVFLGTGFGLMHAFGFSSTESLITGLALMFSSTIVGLKLLPTTVLHHRPIGELVVALLLLQDLIAILALAVLEGSGSDMTATLTGLGAVLALLPVLVAAAFLGTRFLLLPLLTRFDAFPEYLFLLALGWCLGLAWCAKMLGMSLPIGAFIAGVSLATTPLARYIAFSLHPLRDFFLVLFFFSIGAGVNPALLAEVLLPVLALSLIVILLKPLTFFGLLRLQGESDAIAREAGFRLGQASEFSLLLAYVAGARGLLGAEAAHVILGATVITLVLSTYAVIFRYPSPIAPDPHLRRD